MTAPRYISLGAGVQSSVMALMSTLGELPHVDFAIFADTQDEPPAVYRWLDWLEKRLAFPLKRVSIGRLSDEAKRVIRSKKSGNLYCKGGIPLFQRKPPKPDGSPADGSPAASMLRRQCTSRFKIEPIQRYVRKLVQKGDVAEQWIGISTDEAHRMKPSQKPYIKSRWPLIEVGMSRADCLKWADGHGLPRPPRSACIYCPYHSNEEWRRLRDEDPSSFAKAVALEREFRQSWAKQEALENVDVYLHRSCVPLDQVDFGGEVKSGMGNECEGMCGV